jgi:putative phosphoesterase
MKLIVFSDSHNSVHNMRTALSLHRDADVVIHLGDGNEDLESLRDEFPLAQFRYVAGNFEEFASSFAARNRLEYEVVFDFDGKRVLAVHGHRCAVKYGTETLAARAKALGADIALYGHTHEAAEECIDGSDGRIIRLFNPGTVSGRGGDATYGVIETAGGVIITGWGRFER